MRCCCLGFHLTSSVSNHIVSDISSFIFFSCSLSHLSLFSETKLYTPAEWGILCFHPEEDQAGDLCIALEVCASINIWCFIEFIMKAICTVHWGIKQTFMLWPLPPLTVLLVRRLPGWSLVYLFNSAEQTVAAGHGIFQKAGRQQRGEYCSDQSMAFSLKAYGAYASLLINPSKWHKASLGHGHGAWTQHHAQVNADVPTNNCFGHDGTLACC